MLSKGLMAGLVVVGAALVAPAPAGAGSRMAVYAGERDCGPNGYDTYQLGYSRGFRDGFDKGRDDRDDRDGYDLWRERRYRNADSGYHSEYGPKWEYQRGYRAGYESGYRRSYARAFEPNRFRHRDDGYGDARGYWRDRDPDYRR